MRAHQTEDGWWVVRPDAGHGTELREGTEQTSFVSWCRAAGIPVHHSPNGARLKPGQALRLKREGMASGFPDLILPTKRCVIELKKAKAGATSDEQKAWLAIFASIGWTAAEAHGEEAARWVVTDLCGGGKRSACH